MEILGPFYLENSAQKKNFMSCEDDCSRKTVSEWSERKRSIDILLQVLEDYIVENYKHEKVMHDNDKQYTKIFRRFLKKSDIKDKSISAC